MPTFSTVSQERLMTCHPDLQRLFREVVKSVDCTVLCGHRNQADQTLAYSTGNSHEPWPKSKHNALPSHAVDVAPYPIDWSDLERFRHFAVIVKEVAARLGIRVVWGGDWVSFKDLPHWQVEAA